MPKSLLQAAQVENHLLKLTSRESQIQKSSCSDKKWAIGYLTDDPEKATALRTVKLPIA